MNPILFNTEMVRAIQNGTKTVTRRVVKPQPAGDGSKPEPLTTRPGYWNTWGDDYVYRQPYRPGDTLYVRETWNCLPIPEPLRGTSQTYWYKADESNPEDKWRPSIHMPREAARIFLRVTDVRVERLQDIKERGKFNASAEAEGFCNDINLYDGTGKSATKHFAEAWDSTIKPKDRALYGWAANPWVWVIAFERIRKEEAMRNE